MSEETSTEKAAALVAARRRTRKSGAEPPPLPATPVLDAPVAADAPAEAPPAYRPGQPVLVSAALHAEFAAHVSTGITGARINAGDLMYGGGAAAQALVQPQSTAYGTTPGDENYVVAEFDAEESMVPPGCKTPVSRLLWQKGWKVRKDFYAAVAQRRSVADQEAARVSPAKLPAGGNQPPAGLINADTPTASPVITPAPGAPA